MYSDYSFLYNFPLLENQNHLDPVLERLHMKYEVFGFLF